MDMELPEKLQQLNDDLEEVLLEFQDSVRRQVVLMGTRAATASDFNELGKNLDSVLASFKEALIDYLNELEYDVGRN
jgi:hypothetical protein